MIAGIVAAVPKNIERVDDESFTKATHVQERRIVVAGEADTGTLAIAAARRALEAMDWSPDSLQAIICVTQSAPVRMPALACQIAGALGASCAGFDINLACSGYVYGLVVAQAFAGGRCLLIAGDAVSTMVNPKDRGTAMLFGDCVTATALEAGRFMNVQMGTDGSGFDNLIADPLIRMDGPEVFNFTLRTVPDLVARTTMNAKVDWHLFHGANGHILTHLIKKMKLDAAKCPMNLQRYGNTSSASIPLLLCDSEATKALKERRNRVAMFGFGAGYSWAGVMMDVEPIKVLEVIEI